MKKIEKVKTVFFALLLNVFIFVGAYAIGCGIIKKDLALILAGTFVLTIWFSTLYITYKKETKTQAVVYPQNLETLNGITTEDITDLLNLASKVASLKHSIEEKPENGRHFIIFAKEKIPHILQNNGAITNYWEKINNIYGITFWAYVEDIEDLMNWSPKKKSKDHNFGRTLFNKIVKEENEAWQRAKEASELFRKRRRRMEKVTCPKCKTMIFFPIGTKNLNCQCGETVKL